MAENSVGVAAANPGIFAKWRVFPHQIYFKFVNYFVVPFSLQNCQQEMEAVPTEPKVLATREAVLSAAPAIRTVRGTDSSLTITAKF